MIENTTVWYEARSLDGVYRKILDKEYFKTGSSVEEVKQALDRSERKEKYMICMVTYTKKFSEKGIIHSITEKTEAIEAY